MVAIQPLVPEVSAPKTQRPNRRQNSAKQLRFFSLEKHVFSSFGYVATKLFPVKEGWERNMCPLWPDWGFHTKRMDPNLAKAKTKKREWKIGVGQFPALISFGFCHNFCVVVVAFVHQKWYHNKIIYDRF